MFFIVGISPKTKILDQNAKRCPVCGLHQAYYKRVDYYLSLFFIPLLRVKKGDPFIMCDRCERAVSEFGPDFSRQTGDTPKTCRFCNRSLDGDFNYCPYVCLKLSINLTILTARVNSCREILMNLLYPIFPYAALYYISNYYM